MTTPAPLRASTAARLASAYASTETRPHQAERLAGAYEPDAALDALLADPDRRAALGPADRLAAGYYAAAKAAAEAIGTTR